MPRYDPVPVDRQVGSTRPAEVDATDGLAPPPKRRHRQPREQLKTQVLPDVRARLDAFCAAHDSTIQDVIEAALLEYMSRRGGT